MIAAESLDGILIVTPPEHHVEAARAAAAAGISVYCEKPLAQSVLETSTMVAETSTVATMTGFTLRWLMGLRLLQQTASSGVLGELRHCRVFYLFSTDASPSTEWSWRHDAQQERFGVLSDLGPHAFDLVRWIAGEIVAVSAIGKVVIDRRRADKPTSASESDTKPVTSLDDCDIQARLSSGASATVALSRVAPLVEQRITIRIDVQGSMGSASFSLADPDSIHLVTASGSEKKTAHSDRSAGLSDLEESDPTNPFRISGIDQMADFVALASGSHPARNDYPTFADGHRAQQVIDAAATSIRQPGWVPVSTKPTNSDNQP